MTVCIAAQCLYKGSPCFVLCTDARLEDDYSGGDVALKMEASSGNWMHLIAGNVARAQEFMAIMRAHTDTHTEEEAEVIQAFRVAPRLMKQRLVAEYLDTRWGIGLDNFRENGAKHFPVDTYARIHAEIEQIEIGCEVVIAGYAGNVPVLCLVNRSGSVTPHTGFATAGSGYLLAQASLFRRNYRWSYRIEQAIYAVYEAKRLAEMAPGVGKTTNMAVFGPLRKLNGGSIRTASVSFVSPAGFAELDKQLARYGPKDLDAMPNMDPNKMMFWPELGE